MSNVFIYKHTIQKAIERLATQINQEFADKDPVLLCVLNGGFMFFSDLVRLITIKHQVDFVKVFNNKKAPGEIQWLLKPTIDIEGRYVIIVDDILDTGKTASFISSSLTMHKAKAVWVCVLLSKMVNRIKTVFCPYVGIDIVDNCVYGYGLDLEDRSRNLTDIYVE